MNKKTIKSINFYFLHRNWSKLLKDSFEVCLSWWGWVFPWFPTRHRFDGQILCLFWTKCRKMTQFFENLWHLDILPTFCQHFANILPTCCQHVSDMLLTCTTKCLCDFIVFEKNKMYQKLIWWLEDFAGLFSAWTMTKVSIVLYCKLYLIWLIKVLSNIQLSTLSGIHLAKFVWLDKLHNMEYVRKIRAKYPSLYKLVFSVFHKTIFGDTLPEETIQSQFYDGLTSDHNITIIFVFYPDSSILMLYFNTTGCFQK